MVGELNEFDQQIKANPDSPYNMSSLGTVNYTLTSQTKINEALRMYEEAQQPGKVQPKRAAMSKTAIERIRPNNGLEAVSMMVRLLIRVYNLSVIFPC